MSRPFKNRNILPKTFQNRTKWTENYSESFRIASAWPGSAKNQVVGTLRTCFNTVSVGGTLTAFWTNILAWPNFMSSIRITLLKPDHSTYPEHWPNNYLEIPQMSLVENMFSRFSKLSHGILIIGAAVHAIFLCSSLIACESEHQQRHSVPPDSNHCIKSMQIALI